MIFVTVGSQKFQFNRLLRKVDELVKEKKITEEVFAQIGNSDYLPKNFRWTRFMDREKFEKMMEDSNIIITHGGTGVIIKSIKLGKKTIVIPRQKAFKEHVDDHQKQIAREFDQKFVETVYDIDDLEQKLNEIKEKKFEKYVSNTNNIISSIRKFIESDIK